MTTKNVRKNINFLRALRDRHTGRVPTSIQQKINNVVDLYEDRKITQLTTAENLINGIATNNQKQRTKGLKQYEKAIEKYQEQQPITERMKATAEKARQGKVVKRVRNTIRRTSQASVASRLTRAVSNNRGFGERKSYAITYMLFTNQESEKSIRPAFRVNGIPYFPIFAGRPPILANIKVTPFIETLVRRRITKPDEHPLFKKVMMFLKRELDSVVDPDLLNYVDAIVIYSAEQVESPENFDVEEEDLRETKNVSIYNNYHETWIDPEEETVREAIQNKTYNENECWINALLETYKDTELTREKRGSLAKTLSRKKILELLDRTEENIHKGASIKAMKSVFEYFSIPVKLYDTWLNTIFRYIPRNYTKGHSKKIFMAFIKNNHVYPINDNRERLSQLKGEKSLEFSASKNFYISDMTEPPKYKMFSHIDELLKLTEKDEYHLVFRGSLLYTVLYQLKRAGYEPYIRYRAGRVSELKVRFYYENRKKPVIYHIYTQDLSKDTIDRQVICKKEDKYNNIAEAMFHFKRKLFSQSHMSYYDDVDLQILDECRTTVPMGYFDKTVDEKNLVEIDRTKAFTWAFNKIRRIPVFNAFDSWKHWDDTLDINKLSSLTLYKVKVKSANIFFNKKYNLIYGKFLRKMDLSEIKIIYYKQPSFIHKVNYKKIVDELWETPLGSNEDEDKQIKKTIANVNFGMLEKSKNVSQRSVIFNSLKEACHYQRKYGGRIYAIQEESEINYWDRKVRVYYFDDSDDEEEEEQAHLLYEETKEGEKYYILNTSDRQTLVNGYRYIKELLLQYHNYAMYETYNILVKNGIGVCSVKSDAFTMTKHDFDRVKGNPYYKIINTFRETEIVLREPILNFEKGIGNWRVPDTPVHFPPKKYKFSYNKLIPIPTQENESLDVVNEWETEDICKQIIESNPCMIRAKFAGSGKSFVGTYFKKLGYNVLFVVPHNRLSQEIEGEATTLNTFFRIPVNKGDELPTFDHSAYDVIFFDEIFMSNIFIYNKIREFVKNNPNKIIIGAGDTKQLQPINDLTNTQSHDQYADQCIDKIFKYNIYLKICKRVGEKDRITLDDMYNDFWINRLPIKDFIEKYFRYTDEINPDHMNIAYTNIRCKSVSDEVRKKLGKKKLYEVNEEMICRLYLKHNGVNFNANIRYKILCINSKGIIIENIKTKQKHTLTEELLNKHFRYGYCATCHSCQGASINNNITIHEWDKSYLVSREWLWTSLTRARDFNKVAFFKNDKVDEKMEKQLLINYLKNKIDGYKKQDLKAGRDLNEKNYVDVNFCMERLRGTCQKCGGDFHIEIKKGALSSNFTCQRVDNEFSHTKDNCVAYCCYCNCSSR